MTALAKAMTQQTFDATEWQGRLTAATAQQASVSMLVLNLVLEARGNMPLEAARRALQDAFAQGVMVAHGVSREEAVRTPSVKVRVSDALCVFRAKTLPADLPKSLQYAARAVREASKDSAKVVKSKPVGVVKPMTAKLAKMDALGQVTEGLAKLAELASGDEDVVALVAQLAEIARELEGVVTQ